MVTANRKTSSALEVLLFYDAGGVETRAPRRHPGTNSCVADPDLNC